MVALDGNRNAPLDVGPSDGKIVEAAFDKLDQLVAPIIGLYELGLALIQFEQPILERAQFEEVVLFGNGFGGTAAIRAGIPGIGIVYVQLVMKTVLAGVRPFVDVAVAQASVKEILDRF